MMVKCTVNLSLEEYGQLVATIKGDTKGRVTCQDVLVTDMAATVTVLASTPAALLLIGIRAGRALPADSRVAKPGPAPDTGKEATV